MISENYLLMVCSPSTASSGV